MCLSVYLNRCVFLSISIDVEYKSLAFLKKKKNSWKITNEWVLLQYYINLSLYPFEPYRDFYVKQEILLIQRIWLWDSVSFTFENNLQIKLPLNQKIQLKMVEYVIAIELFNTCINLKQHPNKNLIWPESESKWITKKLFWNEARL